MKCALGEGYTRRADLEGRGSIVPPAQFISQSPWTKIHISEIVQLGNLEIPRVLVILLKPTTLYPQAPNGQVCQAIEKWNESCLQTF